jgi:hypothetical protein
MTITRFCASFWVFSQLNPLGYRFIAFMETGEKGFTIALTKPAARLYKGKKRLFGLL